MNSILENQFDTANNVIKELRTLVTENDMSFIDAALHYSQASGMDIEMIAEIIKKDPLVKSKIEIEGEELHFLKKTRRLPI